ncbi:MAG: CorA family divalent cation transporter [Alkalispirochaeta sp.]
MVAPLRRIREWRSIFRPPGEIPHVPHAPTTVMLLEFNKNSVTDQRTIAYKEVDSLPPVPTGAVRWLHVDGIEAGPASTTCLAAVGTDHLEREDLHTPGHRPKVSSLSDQGTVLAVTPVLEWNETSRRVEERQIGIVCRGSVVVTLAEKGVSSIGAVRERVLSGGGRVRQMPAEYLAYLILDSAVDQMSHIPAAMLEQIEDIEDTILEGRDDTAVFRAVQGLRSDAVAARRILGALNGELRASLGGAGQVAPPLWSKELVPYVKDLVDHAVMMVEIFDTRRDQSAGLVPLHTAVTGARMNQVMKTLTIIATIFIPLTFVAGIYGMNFVHMPELQWWWAYPAVILLMGVIAGVMLFLFRRKHWL